MRTLYWVMIAGALGCGSVKDNETPDAPGSQADAPPGGADAPPPACDVTKPFMTAIDLPELHDANANEIHPTLSADELTIYFGTDRPVGGGGSPKYHIWKATRGTPTAAFSGPVLANDMFSVEGESNPAVSADGNTIFFDSFRVSAGTVHIFTATRTSAAVAFPMATKLNGDFLVEPTVTRDGSALYAANLSSGALVRMDKAGAGFGDPQPVSLPSQLTIVAPVTSDDLTMFVAIGNSPGNSIGAATRPNKNAGFSTATALPELAVVGSTVAQPGWASPDGCRLYVSYAVGGKSKIYVATRPK